MKRIFISVPYFFPGYKGGGPVQSVKNIIKYLSGELELYVLTSDRDWKDKKPYGGIDTDKWLEYENAKVFYTKPPKLSFLKLKCILNNVSYDILYLNSFFHYRFSIQVVLLRKMRLIKPKLSIIAPRGEFSPGALKLKYLKKILFISIVKMLHLYRDVLWHATSDEEKRNIESIFGSKIKIKVARNLTAYHGGNISYEKITDKKKSELKIIFVSRIHPKKNLLQAIKIVGQLKGEIGFHIYGPLEDNAYWALCKKEITKMPPSINVMYKGSLTHKQIMDVYKYYHVFLLPTFGENYGHVIQEALIGGCPVVISDQTPWRSMDKLSAGWDIPLDQEDKFISVLQNYVDMNQEQYNAVSKSAFEYGNTVSNIDIDVEKTLDIFLGAT